MKRVILVLLLVLAMVSVADGQKRIGGVQRGGSSGAGDPLRTPTGGGAVSGGGAPTSTCTQRTAEDWNCSNSDSPNCDVTWTEIATDADIVSNQLKAISSTPVVAPSTTFTSHSTSETQYFRVTLSTIASVPTFALRSNSDGSNSYTFYCIGSGIAFYDTDSQVGASGSMTCANGDILGVVIRGKGASTVASFFKNPTEVKPFSGGSACADTSKPCWNDTNHTPNVQITGTPSPTSEAATNIYSYIYFQGINAIVDDYYNGDCTD